MFDQENNHKQVLRVSNFSLPFGVFYSILRLIKERSLNSEDFPQGVYVFGACVISALAFHNSHDLLCVVISKEALYKFP